MAVLRAVAQFEHITGLPRDRAVNTFHFNGPADAPTLADIRDRVIDFYTADQANGPKVGAFLSHVLQSFRVKVYDVTVEPSGPPLVESASVNLPARAGVANLASEVAICLSFQGTPAGGLIQRRRRGRIYLGPLNDAALANPGNAGAAVQRPSASVLTTLRNAGIKLATEVDDTAEWVVYSRPFPGRVGAVKDNGDPKPDLPARAGSTVNIDEVWTDDAFDTQRRRGERATGRTLVLTGE